jgi:hypothetical protein
MRVIDATLGGRADGPLLVSNTGGRLDRHDAARIVARLARRAGLAKHITPHSLRHTMVTWRWTPGSPCATSKTPPATPTRAPPAATTERDMPLTGTPPTPLGAFLAGEVAFPTTSANRRRPPGPRATSVTSDVVTTGLSEAGGQTPIP